MRCRNVAVYTKDLTHPSRGVRPGRRRHDQESASDQSRNVAARLYLSSPMVGPNDDITSTFLIRPEELQMLVQVARHVNPSNDTSAPFYTPPISMPVLYAGASPGLTGLDQVNISLASNLSGSGESNVILTVDGRYPIQSRSTFNKVLRVSSHPQFRCHR